MVRIALIFGFYVPFMFATGIQDPDKLDLDLETELMLAPTWTPEELNAVFDPMPLRVSSSGGTLYHQPFCQYAQAALVKYGPTKRVNYYTVAQVTASKKGSCPLCQPELYAPPEDPQKFAESGTDLFKPERHEYKEPVINSGYYVCWFNRHLFTIRPEGIPCSQPFQITVEGGSQVTLTSPIQWANPIGCGIGDANEDVDITEADFDYCIACYSGNGVPATQTCQMYFDFDNDCDVDMADFQAFLQHNGSGMTAWMHDHWPDAVDKKVPRPVAGGMASSTKYHWTKSAKLQGLKQMYGLYKYIEWYSCDALRASGRVPDDQNFNPCNLP
jgi:hypothetical protein